MPNPQKPTVKLSSETMALIREEGIMGESYEGVIIRLIKEVREYRRRCG